MYGPPHPKNRTVKKKILSFSRSNANLSLIWSQKNMIFTDMSFKVVFTPMRVLYNYDDSIRNIGKDTLADDGI